MAKPAKPSITALVDELGRLSEKLAQAKKHEKRSEEIKKLLREHADPEGRKNADTITPIRGKKFIAEVGAKPPRRSIRSVARVFRLMGETTFLEACTITIKAIEEHLTPKERAEVLEHGHGKTRPVTVRKR